MLYITRYNKRHVVVSSRITNNSGTQSQLTQKQWNTKNLCDPYTLGCVRKWHPATSFAYAKAWFDRQDVCSINVVKMKTSEYELEVEGNEDEELLKSQTHSQNFFSEGNNGYYCYYSSSPHKSSLRAAYAEFARIFAMVSGNKKMNNQRHEKHNLRILKSRSGFNSWDGFINTIATTTNV